MMEQNVCLTLSLPAHLRSLPQHALALSALLGPLKIHFVYIFNARKKKKKKAQVKLFLAPVT